MNRLVLASLLALAFAARAQPSVPVVPHSGLLLGAGDVPVNVPTLVTVRIWNDATLAAPANLVFEDAFPNTPVFQGYYTILIGDTTLAGHGAKGVDPAWFTSDVWLGVSVEGSAEFTPRTRLAPVTAARLAARATIAGNVDGIVAIANGGTGASSAAAARTNLGLGALATLAPAGGATAFLRGDGTFAAMPDASAISKGLAQAGTGLLASAGTLSVAYGSAAGTAAEGNDPRLANARAPTGAASGDLAGSYPGPVVAGLRSRPVADTTPQIGDMLVWNGAAWAPQAAGSGGSIGGNARTSAGASCKALHDAGARGDGYYWLDPNGGGNEDAFRAWCDMAGGGWTLCFSYDTAEYDFWEWPTVAAGRDKLLSKQWGLTELFGQGSKKGNFCNRLAVTAGATQLRAEAARVNDDRQLDTGTFTLGKAAFFTQVHATASGPFDCLVDATGTKRLMYANYASPAKTYNANAVTACTATAGTAGQHLDRSVGVQAYTHGVDAFLIFNGAAAGSNSNEIALHTNWYSDTATNTLFVSSGSETVSKWGVSGTWFANTFGRSGASPGPFMCTTACGYTNFANNVFKLRLWMR